MTTPEVIDPTSLPSMELRTTRRVYVASKAKHAPMWQRARIDYDGKLEFVSTWIDEAGPGESDLVSLWNRCVFEAGSADFLVAYYEHDEEWKGAFVEIGAALAHRRRVLLIGQPPGSWVNHPLIKRFISVYDALDYAEKGPL